MEEIRKELEAELISMGDSLTSDWFGAITPGDDATRPYFAALIAPIVESIKRRFPALGVPDAGFRRDAVATSLATESSLFEMLLLRHHVLRPLNRVLVGHAEFLARGEKPDEHRVDLMDAAHALRASLQNYGNNAVGYEELLGQLKERVEFLQGLDISKLRQSARDLQKAVAPLQQVVAALEQKTAAVEARGGQAVTELQNQWSQVLRTFNQNAQLSLGEVRKQLDGSVQLAERVAADNELSLTTTQQRLAEPDDAFTGRATKADEQVTSAAELIESIRKLRDDATEILKLGTLHHELGYFREVATSHKWSGIFSLAAAAALGGGLLYAMSQLSGSPPPEPAIPWTAAGNLSHLGSRLLFFSIFSFGLVVAVRSYRAAKHNQVINQHREKSLATLQALRESLQEGRLKEVVFVQAISAIIAPQATGYSDTAPIGTHLTELVAALGNPIKPEAAAQMAATKGDDKA